MILYLDTSSLVKLYVDEPGTGDVRSSMEEAAIAATSIVAYAEARAAFARKFRESSLTSEEYRGIKEALDADWDKYLVLRVTDDLVQEAGMLAEKHALRGFDSIHLACAVTLRRESTSRVKFSCYDEELKQAFLKESFEG
jgi:predicted nucleic acid-binding protein